MQNHPAIRQPVILQLIPELETGGAERGTVDMAIAIQQAGGRPIVASAGGKLAHELDEAGITHLEWPQLKSKNPLKIMQNARRLEKLIKDEGVNLVHARSRAPAWSGWRAARAAGVPFMTTFHAAYNYKGRLKHWYNSVMARGARVIAISGFIRDHILANYGTDRDIIRLVHRGIDMQKFSQLAVSAERIEALRIQWGVPADASIVLLPGRLTRWKGQMVLVEAMAQLTDLNAVAVCIGSDQGRHAYTALLQKLIAKLGLEGKVFLPGDCTDMPAAYALASVVVSASIEPEAFGRVIIEAQAMGKPVVASDVGAVAETVRLGNCGWVVPPSDPAALAATLRHALTLPPAGYQRLSFAARDFAAATYTKELMATKTLTVYNELLPEGQKLNVGEA